MLSLDVCYSISYFIEMLVLALSEETGETELPDQPGAQPDILLRNN